MNKKQALLLLSLGAVAGAGGKTTAEYLYGQAEAHKPVPLVHNAHLARGTSPEGKPLLSVDAFATAKTDGGTRDIGRAVRCNLSPKTQGALLDGLVALGAECEW